MNEELTKELIAILRAMKDGAPDAWHVLVEQRATYCLTLGIVLAVIFSASVLLCIFGVRKIGSAIKAPMDSYRYFDETRNRMSSASQFTLNVGLAFCGVGLLAVAITLPHSVLMISEGLAPLGRILEAIR